MEPRSLSKSGCSVVLHEPKEMLLLERHSDSRDTDELDKPSDIELMETDTGEEGDASQGDTARSLLI